MEFVEAQKEAMGCTKCGLCHSRTQVVFGEGPLNAALFIVGEAPGPITLIGSPGGPGRENPADLSRAAGR